MNIKNQLQGYKLQNQKQNPVSFSAQAENKVSNKKQIKNTTIIPMAKFDAKMGKSFLSQLSFNGHIENGHTVGNKGHVAINSGTISPDISSIEILPHNTSPKKVSVYVLDADDTEVIYSRRRKEVSNIDNKNTYPADCIYDPLKKNRIFNCESRARSARHIRRTKEANVKACEEVIENKITKHSEKLPTPTVAKIKKGIESGLKKI